MMTHRLLPSVLAAGTLLALGACAKLDLREAPRPQGTTTSNVTPITPATMEIQGVDALQVTNGTNGMHYFRYSSLEPSGGNKLYMWQSTAANNNQIPYANSPGAPTYLPSPGAVDVDVQSTGQPIIVSKSGDIYFRQGGIWNPLNGNGLQFTKIAVQNLELSPSDTPSGASINGNGLLYAISRNGAVYKLDQQTGDWVVVDSSIKAQSIAVDVFGYVWVVTQTYRVSNNPSVFSQATLLRGGGYGNSSTGWAGYGGGLPATVSPSQVTVTNGFAHPGVEVLAGRTVYYHDLTTSGTTFDPMYTTSSTETYLTIYGGWMEQFWICHVKSASGAIYMYRSNFDGS